MRSFALVASLVALVVAQVSSAEQVTQGFAPACSNAACPHPVVTVQAEPLQQVGPRLFAPVINSDADAPGPAPIRDYNVRVASNNVASDSTAEKNALLQEKLVEAARLQSEIQKLRAELGQSQQILVKVKMLEVSLTKLRKLGVDISFADDDKFDAMDCASLRKAIELSSTSRADKNSDAAAKGLARSFVDSLIANNIAKVLAEPSLVVVSGRPAQFFCGTEMPMRVRDGAGAAVEFQRCGTEVDVVASSMNDNRVRLELRARVSERGDDHSIRDVNSSTPGLQVHQCDTAVETKFGQPVVLNAITEKRVEVIKSESGTREDENEIALVLVVTPELVEAQKKAEKPANATQTK